MISNTESRFREWYAAEKSNGLVDLKVTMNPDAKNPTPDALMEEIMQIDEAIKAGRYSPIPANF